MSLDYTFILRSCPEGHRESAALFLGKLFSLKEHTCQQIIGSCPIVMLTGLGSEEAAAVLVLSHRLALIGVSIEIVPHAAADLPKIDWPRRPQLFKRELVDWVADLQMSITLAGGVQTKLLDVLVTSLEGGRAGTKAEFRGQALPEVTPAATPILTDTDGGLLPPPVSIPPQVTTSTTRTPLPPPAFTPPSTRTPLPTAPAGGEDTMSRLNELFPEEEGGGFMPGKDDITNILNRILPDEQGAGAGDSEPQGSRRSTNTNSGFSVFLAKIADEERRKKAVTLIAELSKIPVAEAEALSKKMIIPALRGVSKEEAEAAKVQFGKIGILARVKGSE